MKKLTLDMDELVVDSFATAQRAAEDGTAEAFSTPTGCRICPTPP